MVPLVVEFFQKLFNNYTADFPYYLNAGLLGVTFIVGLLNRKSFVWLTGNKKTAGPKA